MMTSEKLPAEECAEHWWAGVKNGVILYQHCGSCGATVFYPRSHCSNCLSDALSWRQSTGNGAVYAVTEVHKPVSSKPHDASSTIVLVELDEGFRLLSRMVVNNPPVQIGDRVRAVFGMAPTQEIFPLFQSEPS